jgi:hypothetical protein
MPANHRASSVIKFLSFCCRATATLVDLCWRQELLGVDARRWGQRPADRDHLLPRRSHGAGPGDGIARSIVFEPHVYRHIVGSTLSRARADGIVTGESSFRILRIAADRGMRGPMAATYLDEIVASAGATRFCGQTVGARLGTHRRPARDLTLTASVMADVSITAGPLEASREGRPAPILPYHERLIHMRWSSEAR